MMYSLTKKKSDITFSVTKSRMLVQAVSIESHLRESLIGQG
jgi:hypothetical protein